METLGVLCLFAVFVVIVTVVMILALSAFHPLQDAIDASNNADDIMQFMFGEEWLETRRQFTDLLALFNNLIHQEQNRFSAHILTTAHSGYPWHSNPGNSTTLYKTDPRVFQLTTFFQSLIDECNAQRGGWISPLDVRNRIGRLHAELLPAA